MAKTDEFRGLAPQVQHDAVRGALLRVLEEEEISEAIFRAIMPKLGAIHHRLDAIEKKIASPNAPGAVLPVPPRPPAPVEDPAYKALDWTQGMIPTSTGQPVTARDVAIPEETQDTWHTNPME